MPQIVLGWQLTRRVDDAEVRRFIAQVKHRYQGLFQDTIEHCGIWQENQGLLRFDIQREPDPGLHLATNRIICLTGKPSITDDTLNPGAARADALSFYQRVHANPDRVANGMIHRINPPFTLCWFDKGEKEIGVLHDGLGMDSFFISETTGGVVFSNKCWCILQFLDDAPKIDYAAWRYWFCLGWFPGNSTPFQNIRLLDRGEVITADSRTVRTRNEDAFESWMAGDAAAGPELMERAEDSFHKLIVWNQPAKGHYGADLTGGIDSRAVCSVLIKENIACHFVTGGSQFSSDVMIAGQMAKEFHLEWEHEGQSESVPDRQDFSRVVDARFNKMALWGEGLVEPNRFVHFDEHSSPRKLDPYLGGGSSEISKGHFYRSLQAKPGQSFDACERQFLGGCERIVDSILTDDESVALKETLKSQISAGRAYDLQDFGLLDFFYVSQRTRRWQAAHLAVDLFDQSILAFVNIEHIKLAFAMSPVDKADWSFQKFIIRRNAEQLLRVAVNQKRNSRAAKLSTTWEHPERIGWADHFRANGPDYIKKVVARATPLELILDLGKQKQDNSWLRLGTEDWYFYLRLISFYYWYNRYIAQTPEVGPAIWS